MTEKEFILAFLSKTLKLDSTAVASLLYNEDGAELKPDAMTSLLTKQSDFVTKLSKEKKDEGYKAAQREVLTNLENEVKEKFGLDSASKGLDLISEVVEKTKEATGQKPEITDDDIKKSKPYQELQTKVSTLEKESEKKVTAAVEAVKKEFSKKETTATINKMALSNLRSRNPILSQDKEKAERQEQLLLNDLHSIYDFEVDSSGTKVKVLTKDGKLAEDDLGHPIEFTTLVTVRSDMYYDFQAAEDRDAPPDPAKAGVGAGGKSTPFVLKKPVSEKEFMDQHEKIEKDAALKPEERMKLQQDNVKLWKGEAVTV